MRLVVLFLILSVSCFARMGETFEACVARYGQPVTKISDSCYVFKKSGVNIKAYFGPLGVGRIEYSKDRAGSFKTEALSREEILGLLTVNSKTPMHEDRAGVGVDGAWQSADTLVRAFLLRTSPATLQIESVEFAGWEASQAAKRAADKLPGL